MADNLEQLSDEELLEMARSQGIDTTSFGVEEAEPVEAVASDVDYDSLTDEQLLEMASDQGIDTSRYTAPTPTPTPAPNLTTHLTNLEGFSATSYPDGEGRNSIGHGHQITGTEESIIGRNLSAGDTVTEEEASKLLAHDSQKAKDSVWNSLDRKQLEKLSPTQLQGLYSLAYNVGDIATAGPKFTAAFNAGDLDEAAAELKDWVHWRTGDGSTEVAPGLVDRRAQERDMLLSRGAEPEPESVSRRERVAAARGFIVPSEVEAIAGKYNWDPEELAKWIPKYAGEEYRGKLQAAEGMPGVQKALGRLGEAMFFGLPQKLERLSLEDNEDAAVQELSELIESKKTIGEHVLEGVAGLPVPVVGAIGKGFKGAVTAGATAGGIYGASHSRRGDELKAALQGIGLGAVLGSGFYGGAKVVGKVARKFGREASSKISQETRDQIVREKGNLVDEVQQVVDRGRDGRAEIGNSLFDEQTLQGGKGVLDFRKAAPKELIDDLTSNSDIDFDLPSITNRLLKELDETAARGGRSKSGDRMRMADRNILGELQDITGLDTEAALREFILHRRYQFEIIDFVNHQSGLVGRKGITNYSKAIRRLKKLRSSTNEDVLRQDYQRFREKKALQARLRTRISGVVDEPGRGEWFLRSLQDGRYVTDAIDAKYGLELTPILDDLSTASNRVSQSMETVVDMALEGRKLYQKSGLDSSDIIEAIERRADLGDGPDGDAIRYWGNTFQTVRNHVNEYARERLGIRELVPELSGGKGYVPVQALDDVRYIAAMEGRADDLARKYDVESLMDLDDKELGKILDSVYPKQRKAGMGIKDTPEYEFIRGLEIRSSVGRANTPAKFRRAYTEATDVANPTLSQQLDPAALKQRHDSLPDFLREKDLSKILHGYSNQLLKMVHMDAGIKEIRNHGQALLESGDKSAGRYLLNLTADILGSRKTSSAARAQAKVRSWRIEKLREARALPEGSSRRKLKEALSELPEVLSVASANLYPYFLGMRPDAVLRNLMQPLLMTATEITRGASPGYAMRLVAGSTIDTIRAGIRSALGKGRNPYAELAERGYTPGKFRGENIEIMRNGLLGDKSFASIAKGKGKEFLDRTADMSMAAYGWSDLQNRAVTLGMGKRLAFDFLSGSADAIGAVRNMDPGYFNRIMRHKEAGDVDGVEKLISNYLLSKTQFKYDRVSMSEFGREFGGLFSMFSKWPTSLGADFTRNVKHISSGTDQQRAAAIRGMSYRYLGPVIASLVIENQLLDEARNDEPLLRKLVGRDTFAWTPLSSLSGFTSGQFAVPPVVSVPLDIAKSIFRDDKDFSEKATKVISTGSGMTPFGSLYKMGEETLDYLDILGGGKQEK